MAVKSAFRTGGHSALTRSSRKTGFPVTCPPIPSGFWELAENRFSFV